MNLSIFLKTATLLPIKRNLGPVKMTRSLTAAQACRYFKTAACVILFRKPLHPPETIRCRDEEVISRTYSGREIIGFGGKDTRHITCGSLAHGLCIS